MKTATKTEAAPAVILNDAQRAAEAAVVKTAKAATKAVRTVAMAIGEAYRAGVHTAYGLSLPEWAAKTLIGANIPKSTAYYLRDIGTGYAVLGKDRADLFPMEGLRTIVAKAKGDEDAIEEAADIAQGGDAKAAPSLKACRGASGKSEVSHGDALNRIIRAAMNAASNDYLVAITLMEEACDRLQAEHDRAEREAAKSAK